MIRLHRVRPIDVITSGLLAQNVEHGIDLSEAVAGIHEGSAHNSTQLDRSLLVHYVLITYNVNISSIKRGGLAGWLVVYSASRNFAEMFDNHKNRMTGLPSGEETTTIC